MLDPHPSTPPKSTTTTFETILKEVKQGACATRKAWGNPQIVIKHSHATKPIKPGVSPFLYTSHPESKAYPKGTSYPYTPSHLDLLAVDWCYWYE